MTTARRLSLLGWSTALLLVAPGLAFAGEPPPTPPGSTPPAEAPEAPPAPPTPRDEIAQAIAEGRFGAAVVLCGQALQAHTDPDPVALRALCAKAHVGLGDKLLEAGSRANARQRWDEAANLDPRLMDDPGFVSRLTDAKAPTDTKPPGDAKPRPRSWPVAPPTPRPPRPPKVAGPDDGPRFSLGFGLGLSFGFDGLASATMSWLSNQHTLIEVALGIVYPSADVRFRWLGLTDAFTPYLGAGLFVPFGVEDRLGLDLSSYRSLYELGESFNVDLGLMWMPIVGLDLSAGITFVTPFDQAHPDTVLFFPQLSLGATWRF